MNWKERIKYQAKSKDEFNDLEQAMESFFKSYTLETEGHILVAKGFDEWVDISPSGLDKIVGVAALVEPPEGFMRRSNHEGVYLRMEGRGYHIKFDPAKH